MHRAALFFLQVLVRCSYLKTPTSRGHIHPEALSSLMLTFWLKIGKIKTSYPEHTICWPSYSASHHNMLSVTLASLDRNLVSVYFRSFTFTACIILCYCPCYSLSIYCLVGWRVVLHAYITNKILICPVLTEN